ncbi:superoxide dismutase family protein [uncultured Brevundimonas sp.]|uniref:superoxide dismutase family protein n=1 Tax=uncultured Brevundimonas sp. TaxID=213418 RepID=UPI0030ED2AF4|tara:strand:- start:39877 stop:40443 length:567 start_codon:yes stop_codon:yes gene_type:complete
MRPILLASALLLPLGACVSLTENHYGPQPAEQAAMGDFGEATLRNAAGEAIGRAALTQGPTGLLIRIEASGLTPGWHGVHIHATGRCDAPFTSAGGHINHAAPAAPHGLLNPDGPDDGDLPNIHADADGRVNAEVFTSRARIAATGPGQWLWDADGSALVIHAGSDDHRSQPIGGAGGRVACGVMAAG